MADSASRPHQQNGVSISLPKVNVGDQIDGNTINYNTLTGKQDEFSTTPFYSDGLQYGIMQQSIESGNTEGGVASETGLVPSTVQQGFAYNVLFPVPNGQPSTGITFPANSIKEITINDSNPVVSYPPQSATSLFPQATEKADPAVNAERSPVDVPFYQQGQRPSPSGFFSNALIDSENDDKEYEYVDHPMYTERKRLRRGHLENPKRVRSAYNYFSQDFFMGNKNDDASNRETIREVAEKWKNLSDEERSKYQRLSDEDKKRYEREMNTLSEFFKTHNIPPLFSKRERQSFLYSCITHANVECLGNFILVMNNGDMDISLAFVEAVIRALHDRPSNQVLRSEANYSEPSDPMNPQSLEMIQPNSELYPSVPPVDQDLVFKCYYPRCGKVFKSRRNLNNHRKIHDEMRQPCHACTYPGCTKTYLTPYGLSKHMHSHETRTAEFVCPQCKERRVFKTKEGLTLHIKNKHQDKRDYPCTEPGCERSFARKADLRMHLVRCHTAEKPYICEVESCKKSFASMSELQRHRRLHAPSLIVCSQTNTL